MEHNLPNQNNTSIEDVARKKSQALSLTTVLVVIVCIVFLIVGALFLYVYDGMKNAERGINNGMDFQEVEYTEPELTDERKTEILDSLIVPSQSDSEDLVTSDRDVDTQEKEQMLETLQQPDAEAQAEIGTENKRSILDSLGQ